MKAPEPGFHSPPTPPQPQADSQLQMVSGTLLQLQTELVTQFQADIRALQAEKAGLQADVQRLRQTQGTILNQQQVAQQQQWAKQFAQILAQHLQQQLLNLAQSAPPPLHPGDPWDATSLQQRAEAINQLLMSLDATLSGTLGALQQEISSCQHALKGQLAEMHGLERQGEAILETLVQRLSQTLAHYPAAPEGVAQPWGSGAGRDPQGDRPGDRPGDRHVNHPPLARPGDRSASRPPTRPSPPPLDPGGDGRSDRPGPPAPPEDYVLDLESLPKGRSRSPQAPAAGTSDVTPLQRSGEGTPRWTPLGIALALGSVVGLALQYVFVQRLFQTDPVGTGLGSAGEPLAASWGNTWLAVWLRMVMVLPLVVGLGQTFYPNLWQDLQVLRQGGGRTLNPSENRRLIANLVISGGLLFLSQWFLYRSVGLTSAGSGVTLFFLYPALLSLVSWGLLGERPSAFRLYCILALGVGGVATRGVAQDLAGVSLGNLVLALASGGLFALYLLLTNVSSRRLHYSVVTVVQFGVVFLLSTPAMFVVPQLSPPQVQNLVQSGLWLGGAAALSYGLNTFSVRAMGALSTALITALAPFLTVLLGSLLLGDSIPWSLGFGTLAVTLGSTFMNLEHFKR
ncbi:DMT family transporter [Prochlorothrix hollandica]|uniref:DMT family transporter n=1 Tax=Prochlorothrix hollandica TaxID=1223 RepID=UPI0033426E4D